MTRWGTRQAGGLTRWGTRRGPAGSRRDDDRGAVAVLVVIMMTAILIPLAAIVIDLGYLRDLRSQAQTTADSAALAAALTYLNDAADPDTVRQAKAVQAAQHYVTVNFPQISTEFTTCGTGCVSVDPQAKSVVVTLPPVTAVQAFVAGSASVHAAATATWAPPNACILCVDGDLAFGDLAPGSITASGGGIAVHGAVVAKSGATGSITVPDGVLSYSGAPPSSSVTILPTGHTQQNRALVLPSTSPVTDQLRALIDDPSLMPMVSGTACAPRDGTLLAYSDATTVGKCKTFAPGIYLVVPTVTQIPFPPYVITNQKLTINGSTTMPGGTVSGALIFPTCGDGTGRPQACDRNNLSTFGADLHARSTSLTPATIDGLQGSPYPALNGYGLVVDPENLDQQSLGGIVVNGNVLVPNGQIQTGTTVNGRLTASSLATQAALTVSTDATQISAPVRLVP